MARDARGCAVPSLAAFGRHRPAVRLGLDWSTCDRARIARDPRFDGWFFTGVLTTRIYCRPTCPVKPAKSRNVVFFATAAAAERAGFRPCLRCRPETAPGTPAWQGAAATVSRALRLIEAGFLDEGRRVDDLADTLGMTSRHLRRLFLRHAGASPTAVAATRRVQRAGEPGADRRARLVHEEDQPEHRADGKAAVDVRGERGGHRARARHRDAAEDRDDE